MPWKAAEAVRLKGTPFPQIWDRADASGRRVVVTDQEVDTLTTAGGASEEDGAFSVRAPRVSGAQSAGMYDSSIDPVTTNCTVACDEL